jgi:hypothetical protein
MDFDWDEPDWMTTGWFTPWTNEKNLCKGVDHLLVTVFYKNGTYSAVWRGHFSERYPTQEQAMRAAKRLVELYPIPAEGDSDTDVDFRRGL